MWPIEQLTHDPRDLWPMTNGTNWTVDPWPMWPIEQLIYDPYDLWSMNHVTNWTNDSWPTWSIEQLTRDPHDLWPMAPITQKFSWTYIARTMLHMPVCLPVCPSVHLSVTRRNSFSITIYCRSNGERILKIGEHLPKLCLKLEWHVFWLTM